MHVLREETRRFEMQHQQLSEVRGRSNPNPNPHPNPNPNPNLNPNPNPSPNPYTNTSTNTNTNQELDGPQLSLPQQKEMLLQKVCTCIASFAR